jgi:hypothetical protein
MRADLIELFFRIANRWDESKTKRASFGSPANPKQEIQSWLHR